MLPTLGSMTGEAIYYMSILLKSGLLDDAVACTAATKRNSGSAGVEGVVLGGHLRFDYYK
jgi:hypothetical protein